MRIYNRRKKNNIFIFCLVFVLVLMGIGYATFSTQLDITGTSNITSNFTVLITNVESGSIVGEAEDLGSDFNDTTATFSAGLVKPGDSITYTITVANKGNVDAVLSGLDVNTGGNEAIVFETSGIKEGNTLLKNTEDKLYVKVSYDSNVTSQPENTENNIEVTLTYEQNNGEDILPETDYLITYDCISNGGSSCTQYNEYSNSANLTNQGNKETYDFIGWNTDKNAHTGLDSLTVNSDVTLYAIYKKDIEVTYKISDNVKNIGKTSDKCSLYNNDESCSITLPNIEVNTGYGVDGWYNGENNVGLSNNKYNISNNTTLIAKAIQTDKEGPTINFNPNSQSNYTNGTEVDINLEDESGIKTGQEISYAWSTSNTESPFTEGGTAPGKVNGTGVVSPQNYRDDISSYAKYDFEKQGTTWVSTNKGVANSYAGLSVKFTLTKISNFSVDFDLSSEENEFYYEIWKDGSLIYDSNNDFINGTIQDTMNGDLEAGSYEFYFYYVNWAGNTTDYDDTLKISNIMIDEVPIEGVPAETAQIGNKEGAKSATVTAPKSSSNSYTGTYYLWVKGGIEDIFGNASEDKVSGAFKFDNSAPTVSISTSSTLYSITVTANASSFSGITKYEFSIDGETWYPSDTNVYTFNGLKPDTEYTVGVRVTNGIGKTSVNSTWGYTEALPLPTFTESGNTEQKTVTITYPEGCGSTYICSYIKNDGQPVEVNTQTVNVDFTSDGTLIGIVSDGTSENSNVYEVEMIGTMKSWSMYSSTDFHSSTYKNKITSAEVVDYKTVPDNAVKSWDVSEKGNGSVMAWIINDPDNSGYYKLYIGGDGGVRANQNSSDIFYNFKSLKTVDLTKLDTSQVTNMSSMFHGCSSLTTLDVSGFDTSKVTNMYQMFYDCSSLTELDVSGFDTSNVTNMGLMFSDCSSLTELDVSNWNTSKVTNMQMMFNNCSKLTTLDLSNWDTSNVTDSMSSMFNGCSNLTEITFGENFDTGNTTDINQMFRGCSKLTTLDLSPFDTSNVTEMNHMFADCSNLTEITFGENFDTSQVKRMHYMFSNCSKLTTLDLSGFDTSNVTSMWRMFEDCSDLTEITFGENFDTSQVTDMALMFSGCSSLTTLDVSGFDTSNVTNMGSMFNNCSKLTTLDVSNWDTSNVTNMGLMFSDCNKLTTLDLSNWDTSQVTDMAQMFNICNNLTEIKFGENFDTSQVTKMDNMFNNCSKLTTLDLSGFDTSNVTDMNGMFWYASKLRIIYVGPNWTTANAVITNMFKGCGTSKVTLKS